MAASAVPHCGCQAIVTQRPSPVATDATSSMSNATCQSSMSKPFITCADWTMPWTENGTNLVKFGGMTTRWPCPPRDRGCLIPRAQAPRFVWQSSASPNYLYASFSFGVRNWIDRKGGDCNFSPCLRGRRALAAFGRQGLICLHSLWTSGVEQTCFD